VSASPIVQIFYPAYQRFIQGVCLTHRLDILSALSVFYAGFFASPEGVCLTHRLDILFRL